MPRDQPPVGPFSSTTSTREEKERGPGNEVGNRHDPGSGKDIFGNRVSGKRKISWRGLGFDCSLGSERRQNLGTGCGIFCCLSVGNLENSHDPNKCSSPLDTKFLEFLKQFSGLRQSVEFRDCI